MWCGDKLVYAENEYVKFNERKRSAIFQRSMGRFDIFLILFLLYVEGRDMLGNEQAPGYFILVSLRNTKLARQSSSEHFKFGSPC